MQKIILDSPLDMHLHLREGEMLERVAKYSSNSFSGAVVMPNLKTPITNTDLALQYKKEILNVTEDFEPIMTLFISSQLDKEELQKAKSENINILKLYPKGATTNSGNGVKEVLSREMMEIFENAQNLDMVLSIHGESGGFCMDREFEFLEVFEQIAKDFPRLRIIIEHMSDHRSIRLLEQYPNIYATLTLHHISMNLDDVIGAELRAFNFCKPILKTPKDQKALLDLALNAHPKVSFGSDSAPHSAEAKKRGSAGIFSAPIALQGLCDIFDKHSSVDNLQKFVSDNAIKNYSLDNLARKRVTLQRVSMRVESEYSGIASMWPLRDLAWSIL